MTTHDYTPTAHLSTADVDRVDAYARQIFRRARNAGRDFADVSVVVRQLHTVLKHLKAETEDAGSLLNSGDGSIYARQATPIVQDCEFTLKSLDVILERHGASASGSDDDGGRHTVSVEAGELAKIGLLRTKLANQKLNLDMFLDTVQLHNPATSRPVVDTDNANLDSIKDKVDAIAARIFQREGSNASGGAEDELWLQFRNELEKAGFSREVLRRNQDVLRAYIRQLDEQRMISGGVTPTVRGFLEGYKSERDKPRVGSTPIYPQQADDLSPKEMYPTSSSEKFAPSVKTGRVHPAKYPHHPASMPAQTSSLSYDRPSSEDDDADGASDYSTALVISTRDLMASDQREADLAIAMGNMHLQPPNRNYIGASSPGSSPQDRFLPPPSNAGLLMSPNLGPEESGNLSPRYAVSVPPPPYGSSPPPSLRPGSISAPTISGQPPRYASRLAPDSQGRDIPLDAQWTRIKRSLVSPEVLNQAGVRYEARPDFVAILGFFTKEEVAEFARLTVEVRRNRSEKPRKERGGRGSYHPDKYKNWDVESQRRTTNGRSRPRADNPTSSSSDLIDTSDEETDDETPSYRTRRGSNYNAQDEKYDGHHEDEGDKGTKAYPFIVSPPEKGDKGPSPSATVTPKPILKNKNDNPHVRFNPEPEIFEEPQSRSAPRRGYREERSSRDRDRDRDRHIPRSFDDRDFRDRSRDRDDDSRRHSRNHSDASRRRDGRDRDRDRDEYSRRRRDRDRYRDDGDRDRDRYRDDGDRDRDRDRYRDEADRNEERARKKSRNETLKAVGLGGAAVSLLGVLAEAAAGL